MTQDRKLTVVQVLPALESGGVERGTLELGRYLVAHGHRSIVISAGGRMLEQLKREGSEHVEWPVGAKRLGTLRYVRPLRRFLEEQQPDILHLRSRLPAWIGYLAWRRLPPATRPHLVTTVHGPYTPNRYSAVMTRGERVIAVSNTIQDYILAQYPRVDPGIIRVIHRGIDPAAYPYGYHPSPEWLRAWRRDFPQTENRMLLTLPARLTRWKGQEQLIHIVAELRRRGLPVHGLMVGEANRRKARFEEELRGQIQAAGLEDAITLTGHRTDLREIMAISHAVLSLSRDPEAFGRTTIEALSLGRPVIGFDHGGVGEQLAAVFPEGAVPVGDVDALVNKLAEWGASPPLPAREHGFTLDNMCSRTLEVYRELAGHG